MNHSPPNTTALSLPSLSTPGKRPKRAAVSEEPAKKPRKPNSEIRKQQNRIASRNYREKRKRKLQYLQQLINDDEEGPQDADHSPEQHQVYPRSLSADYALAESSSSPYRNQTPSNRAFGSASSAGASQAILPTTVPSFDTQHLTATEQSYPSYPQHWSAQRYSPPPPENISWNIPPAWMATLEYPTQATTATTTATTTRPSMYRYNTHPAQSLYQHTAPSPTPSYLIPSTRGFVSHAGLYGYAVNYTGLSETQDGNRYQQQQQQDVHMFVHDASPFERGVYI